MTRLFTDPASFVLIVTLIYITAMVWAVNANYQPPKQYYPAKFAIMEEV